MIPRSSLYTPKGRPILGLRNALSYYAATLEELEQMVKRGELYASELCSIKGCGSPQNPGKLIQYLFGLPSLSEQRAQRAVDNAGAGI